jgi:hypothetical protein
LISYLDTLLIPFVAAEKKEHFNYYTAMPTLRGASPSCVVERFNPSTNARQGRATQISDALLSLRVLRAPHEGAAVFKLKDPRAKPPPDGGLPTPILKVLLVPGKFNLFSKFADQGKITIRIKWAGLQIMLSGAEPALCRKVVEILAPEQFKRMVAAGGASAAKLKLPLGEISTNSPARVRAGKRAPKPQRVPRRFQHTAPASPVVVARVKKTFSDRSPAAPSSPSSSSSSSSPIITAAAKRSRTKTTGMLDLFGDHLSCSSSSSSFSSSSAGVDVAPERAFSLSAEQTRALALVQAGKSMFVSGPGGTGKSVLISACCAWAKEVHKRLSITATTGVAACNVSGVTIHSWSGLSGREVGTLLGNAQVISPNLIKFVKKKMRQQAKNNWLRTDLLVIDEVSMLDPKYLDLLDQLGQVVRKNSRPFGGIQVVFVGDFHQLPPVAERHSDTAFAFESRCFQRLFGHRGALGEISLLTVVHRQGGDESFVSLLSRARKGQSTNADLARLRACKNKDPCQSMSGVVATHLCTHVYEARQKNKSALQRLPGMHMTFKAKDWSANPGIGKMLAASCRAPEHIELAVGAQVMLVKTVDAPSGLVNGARGLVRRFTPRTGMPVVEFENGVERTLGMERWSVDVNGRQLASRKQLPLDLSWAISIHKAQGMTLEAAVLNLSKVFECGQGYVALSRVRSLVGLTIEGSVNARSFRANGKVCKFYAELEKRMAERDLNST